MQRVLLRNLLARNQALRRQRRQDEVKLKNDMREIRQEKVFVSRLERSLVKAERKHRREDWMLGPLAPNRTAGKDGGAYGMLDQQFIRPPDVIKSERAKYFNFAVNDRVVVVKGREKGKIGQIVDVNEDKQTVELLEMNMVDIRIPPILRDNDSRIPYRSFPMPLHIEDVRLVIPLRDNATGRIKDVVVEHLSGGKPFTEPAYGHTTPKHTRWISGLDIRIPWPESDVKEFRAEEPDTRRVDVEPRSFYLTMGHVPLPNTAVDEIRNKFSKTRSVHTQEYVKQKMKEDAEDLWKKRRRMVLPQQAHWEQQAKQKKAADGIPEVTQETLDLIRDMQAASLGKSHEQRVEGAS